MNNEGVIKFCQLCLIKDETVFGIFSEEGEKLDIQDIITSIFSIEIKQSSSLSICKKCCNMVTEFYKFYKMVLTNQQILKSISKIETTDQKIIISYVQNSDKILCKNDQIQNDAIIEIQITTLENNHNIKDGVKDVSNEQENPNVNENAAENSELPNTDSDFVEVIEYLEIPDRTTDDEDYNESKVETEECHQTTNTKSEKIQNTDNIDQLLPNHLRSRIPNGKYDKQICEYANLSCTICYQNHISFKDLIQHYEMIHQIKGYAICCDKKFYRKDRLMNHIINHIDPDAFKCPECGYISKDKVLLRIHLKGHLPPDQRQFQCEKCPQKFVLRSQLTNHQASHLTKDEKKHKCPECGKAFALKFVMIKHTLTHSSEKNFICDMCARAFSTKHSLQSHMRRNHFEKQPKIQCNHCQQWYKNSETLQAHIRKYIDKRDHTCPTCKKKCSSKSSLATHVRYVHLKIENYECNVCQQRFRRKMELTEHLARHTGEILYKCEFCPKTFASGSNYFAHRKNRHLTKLLSMKNQKLQI